jgi:hypothetical protein
LREEQTAQIMIVPRCAGDRRLRPERALVAVRNTGGARAFFAHDKFALESVQIAREYLEAGELGDGAAPGRFLNDTIEDMIRRGQRNRLGLSNRAISAYQRFRTSGAGVSSPDARTIA